ncbi:MAG TPA: hypothetical protein VG078_00540 [Acidimicrobiales bacterium]|nr:hypothetical protein [Acidimicrobiales bacterium]
MVSDRDRHNLYVDLLDGLGQGPADTVMEMLPPVGWADVARASDSAALRTELGVEMAALRAELTSEVASLRNQLFAANVATTAAVAGLVLATAKPA